MIDLNAAKEGMRRFLQEYEKKDIPGFRLKTVHTYHVAENARWLAEELSLGEEDVKLAELIGLLHDLGRFEELRKTGMLANESFDHGMCGERMLRERGMIRRFIADESYDEIIFAAVRNHNRFTIEEGLDGRMLLHAKLIRDADKLDNFRVKIEEPIEEIFPNRMFSLPQICASDVSEEVMRAIRGHRCVDVHDRKTPLDYMICILAFVFDFSFAPTRQRVRENSYIPMLLKRVECTDPKGIAQLKEAEEIIAGFLSEESDGSAR